MKIILMISLNENHICDSNHAEKRQKNYKISADQTSYQSKANQQISLTLVKGTSNAELQQNKLYDIRALTSTQM